MRADRAKGGKSDDGADAGGPRHPRTIVCDSTIATPLDEVGVKPQLRRDNLLRSFGLSRVLASHRRPMPRAAASRSAAADLPPSRGYGSAERLPTNGKPSGRPTGSPQDASGYPTRGVELRTFDLSRLPVSNGVNVSTVRADAYSTVGILLPIL